jgi:hypothetical protein
MQPPKSCFELEQEEEERRVRRLRRLVDFFLLVIAQSRISLDEAETIVEGVRWQACQLFPDKGETFDLIYKPRFRRLIAEKFALQ